MKKILSLTLAFMLLLSMCLSASAAETAAEQERKPGQVAAGAFHSAWILPDGYVTTTNSAATNIDVSNWEGIVKIAAHHQTLGLRDNGTVVLVDGTERHHLDNGIGKYSVSNWSDIVDIDASECNVAGVTKHGTVVVAGANKYKQCNVSGWKDVVDVELGNRNTYGLKSNGTVLVAGYSGDGHRAASGWKDITAISAGPNHLIGLKTDGTVVATCDYAQDMEFWTDVVAVAAGAWHTVALRADGTVVAAGNNDAGQCNVGGWTDIVAIDAGTYHTVAMRSDGTMVAVGSNEHCQCDVG